eukprot:TRINITY_DN6327_c0_g1_i1.p1 TRINITY_DN6327_c0_g1~~TRINITY_DN6327_c0_g1_i1.p1  ORF type:complete len:171 (+),score=51.78 TRINITY_DN6327_c0_g1_i1:713-1225(+)
MIAKLEIIKRLRVKKSKGSRETNTRNPKVDYIAEFEKGSEKISLDQVQTCQEETILSESKEMSRPDEKEQDVNHETSGVSVGKGTKEEALQGDGTSFKKREEESVNSALYYFSAYTDLDSLVRVRKGWDRYLVQNGERKCFIPAHFISPPPPSSPGWARFLVHEKEMNSS